MLEQHYPHNFIEVITETEGAYPPSVFIPTGGVKMANFNEAFDITMGHEGGYVNDPDDVGGETYRGITKRFEPNWVGWTIITKYREESNFPDNIKEGTDGWNVLDTHVREIYKNKYWNPFCGDEILSQAVANEMFDTGINMGVGRAVKFLQRSLSLLNRNQKLYPDLTDDGAFGRKTLGSLRIYLAQDSDTVLLTMMNVMQGQHYIKYMTKSPTQEKFARGWFTRVTLSKG